MSVQNDQHKRDKKGSRDDNGGDKKDNACFILHKESLFTNTHTYMCVQERHESTRKSIWQVGGQKMLGAIHHPTRRRMSNAQ